MEERRLTPRREVDNCPYQLELQLLTEQTHRIEDFIADTKPLLDYIRSEIALKEKRSEFYQKLSERILGTAIFAIFAIIGSWVLDKLKVDIVGMHK